MTATLDHVSFDPIAAFVKRRKTHICASALYPQVHVEYCWCGEADMPDIVSIEVQGAMLTGESISFFERYGFSQEELMEEIHRKHHRGPDPDAKRE